MLNFQDRGVPELQEALMRPDSYSGLILTTPRAVDALAIAERTLEGGKAHKKRSQLGCCVSTSQVSDWKANLAKWNQKPVYAIGEGTAAEARKLDQYNFVDHLHLRRDKGIDSEHFSEWRTLARNSNETVCHLR